ncbi:relaxase/mobilization nuclease-like protein [Flavobacterium croceum DSM 17960]|uniref:Relaxase/mobilization nuclease-like protein n=1 Tax=Flavobacterium croceum DSM 17960 TaxID=1121886 RepID=A0A2S4N6G1_9FLAO|nr:relaxase/mobilization nuclease domain-containing protein [Flavobacterium croceum]POS00913.1 relaxase/mobilization nuclease-like protein [Flavobacterium croceum DSM 17960]
MIAKISFGKFVEGMVKYNHDKTKEKDFNQDKKAELLGVNNIASTSYETIVATLVGHNMMNTRVSKPNIHISLNFVKEDKIDNDSLLQIAQDYMDELGYGHQPFAIYRHYDKEHPHIHIVSSSISIEGKRISDSNIFRRSQSISRDLEYKYGLTVAVKQKGKKAVTGQSLQERIVSHTKYGVHSAKDLLHEAISDVVKQKPIDYADFDAMLSKHHIKRIATETGNTFVFELEEFKRSSVGLEGVKIDVNFSSPALQYQFEVNEKSKKVGHSKVKGKVKSVIDTLSKDKFMKLSDLEVLLRKKGIKLEVKRVEAEKNKGMVYGMVFTDYATGNRYNASEFNMSTKRIMEYIYDNKKLDAIQSNAQPSAPLPRTQREAPSAGAVLLDGLLSSLLMESVANQVDAPQQTPGLKPPKKRKKRR